MYTNISIKMNDGRRFRAEESYGKITLVEDIDNCVAHYRGQVFDEVVSEIKRQGL